MFSDHEKLCYSVGISYDCTLAYSRQRFVFLSEGTSFGTGTADYIRPICRNDLERSLKVIRIDVFRTSDSSTFS